MGAQISIIDHQPQVARDAEDFGFKVYFGDGTRLDVLHAAGAHQARVVLVCIDDQTATTRIVEHLKAAFPHARVVARSRDREHTIELLRHGVDREVRETFESAMALGRAATQLLGATDESVAEIEARVRRNDVERLDLEMAGGLNAGREKILGNLEHGR